MRKIFRLFSFLLLLYVPAMANAEIKTFTITHTYKMSDNETRNEVRRICFIEAGKSVLEQAAVYVGTLNAAKHYQLSKNEINAYTASMLKVTTPNQEWQDMTVTTTAATDVDTRFVEKMIARIKSDTSLQNQFNEQQQKKRELEQALDALQKKLKLASFSEAEDLRKDRNAAIREIDAIEAKRAEIVEGIIKKSLDAKKRITVKMKKNDVESLLGDADARTFENYNPHKGKTYYVWYYGYTRIYFDGPHVAAID